MGTNNSDSTNSMAQLYRYLGERGVNLLVNEHPTPEEIESIKKNEGRAKEVVEFVKKAVSSKDQAKILLEEAYSKGDFTKVIAHLEEAQKLGDEFTKTKVVTFDETMSKMKGVTYIAGIDPAIDNGEVYLYKAPEKK